MTQVLRSDLGSICLARTTMLSATVAIISSSMQNNLLWGFLNSRFYMMLHVRCSGPWEGFNHNPVFNLLTDSLYHGVTNYNSCMYWSRFCRIFARWLFTWLLLVCLPFNDFTPCLLSDFAYCDKTVMFFTYEAGFCGCLCKLSPALSRFPSRFVGLRFFFFFH